MSYENNSRSSACAEDFGVDVGVSGETNSVSLQSALNFGGHVTLTRPGAYAVASDDFVVPDNTVFFQGPGVTFTVGGVERVLESLRPHTVYGPLGTSVDVVVFGATPAGIAAAVAAARLNEKVLLISQSSRIGGVMGWGINNTDVLSAVTPDVVVGFGREVLARIAANETSEKVFQRFIRRGAVTRPSWCERAFAEIVAAEKNITVFYNTELDSVAMNGTVIEAVNLTGECLQRHVPARVFIDASYTGDLIAAAGCTVSIGRESSATYSEAQAGILSSVAWTGSATVDPYVTAGNASSGLLPGMDSSAAGTVGAGDGRVMPAVFRLFVTTNASVRIPFPAPDMSTYDALNYELLGRAMASAPTSFNQVSELFTLYDLSNGYYDLNSSGAVSTNYMGDESKEYITATPARRAVIRENAKQWILGLIYWIRSSGDVRIPAALITEFADYGLVSNELVASGGFSPELYIREGRRLVGDFVFDQNDISLTNGFTDPIAYGYYDLDSHFVRRIVVAGVAKLEGALLTALTTSQIGYPIPYRVLLPKEAECTNLLSPTCPSVSRVAWCSIRMEPVMLALGQAAGIAAHMARMEDCNVQDINTTRLLSQQDIDRARDAIVLNSDGTYAQGTVTQTGSWATTTSRFGYLGASALSDGNTSKGSLSVKFAPDIWNTGAYQVMFKYPPAATSGRANNVPVYVVHADGTATRTVNQLYPGGQGGEWESLGVFTFLKGQPSANYVTVDNTGTSDFVVASAVKWKPVL